MLTDKECPDWRKRHTNGEIEIFPKYRKKKNVDREDLPELIYVVSSGDCISLMYPRLKKTGIRKEDIPKMVEAELPKPVGYSLCMDVTMGGEVALLTQSVQFIENIVVYEYYEFIGNEFMEVDYWNDFKEKINVNRDKVQQVQEDL